MVTTKQFYFYIILMNEILLLRLAHLFKRSIKAVFVKNTFLKVDL